MASSIDSGTVVYDLKVANPNAIANFDLGKVLKGISEDLNKFVGKPIQGLVVKGSDATTVVKKVKEDMVAAKCAQPWLRAGMSGKDMIFLVTDQKNSKYSRSCVLVADYKGIREKQKKLLAETQVKNLDQGDEVIDRATKDMRNALGAKTDKDLGDIDGSVSIILLAHGDEDKTASGQIYGKDFAGKSPKELVAMLVDNKDKKKRLAPSYAGTIYLDGCFTAQGGAMANYTKQVWELLKAKGIKNCKVKGNLGAAATLKSGDELVTTTEAEKAGDKLTEKANKDFQKKIAPALAKLQDISKTKYAGKTDANFEKDAAVKTLRAALEKTRQEAVKKLQSDLKKIPGYEVKNLVGQFGLTRLN